MPSSYGGYTTHRETMFGTRNLGIVAVATGVIILLCVGNAAAATTSSPSGTLSAPHQGVPQSMPLASVTIHFTIPLGKLPSGGALDTSNGNVYVSSENSNNVTVVNGSTHAHSSIKVGKSPVNLIYDSSDGDIYVPNLNGASVSIIRGASEKVVATPSLGKGAHPYLAYADPANGNVIVFNNTTLATKTQAWMIVASTNAVKTLTLGTVLVAEPAYNPATKEVYVADYLSETVSAISPSGTVKTIAVPGFPLSTFYDPPSGVIWVTLPPPSGATAPKLEVITASDTTSGPFPISAPIGALSIIQPAYDSINHEAYYVGYNYTTNSSYAIGVIAGPTVNAVVKLGSSAGYLEGFVDPANSDIYFESVTKSIAVLSNSSKLVKTISTKQGVVYLVYDPALKDMIGAGDVNLTTTSLLYVIGSSNKISTLTVGKEGIAFVYDPVDSLVYVANLGSDSLDLVG